MEGRFVPQITSSQCFQFRRCSESPLCRPAPQHHNPQTKGRFAPHTAAGAGIHNPRVDVTKETKTLYTSDRDVFLFLIDNLNPIEAGLLPDGLPDL